MAVEHSVEASEHCAEASEHSVGFSEHSVGAYEHSVGASEHSLGASEHSVEASEHYLEASEHFVDYQIRCWLLVELLELPFFVILRCFVFSADDAGVDFAVVLELSSGIFLVETPF